MNLPSNILRFIIGAIVTLPVLSSAIDKTAFIATSRQLPLQKRTCIRSLSTSIAVAKNDDQVYAKQLCDNPRIISDRVFELDQRPVILFDGVCNLCNKGVNLALDWDPKGTLRFCALQSNVGRALLESNGRKSDDISSIVLVTQKGAYIKSDAILKISQELAPPFLPGLKPLSVIGLIAVPKFLRDIIYDGVADNRYDLMGVRDECRFDADGEFEDRFIDDALALQ
mmetsp:Transcript_5796/g.6739  ORF Transcript_5796/g.6739 Transcript_5796/m.6739 type:complete len:226 (+) Transcript_5796:163-840(+)